MTRSSIRSGKCAVRLDAVVPTAIASLDAQRQAQATLQEIDALLALEDITTPSPNAPLCDQSSTSKTNTLPGPGAYDPQKERTQWRHHTNVRMHPRTPAINKKIAIIQREQAREDKTPGPGAYNVAIADRIVKPRVRTAEIRGTNTVGRQEIVPQLSDPLDLTKADKWLSRYVPPKGAVAYKRSNAKERLSREQREKLGRIHVEKTRHMRLGFYSIHYELTERRLGSVGIVPMCKSAGRCLNDSTRHLQAKTKRQLRAWRPANPEAIQIPPKEPKVVPKKQPTRTIQWQRAHSRALCSTRELPHRQIEPENHSHDGVGLSTRSLRRDLVAHNMNKYTGRDTIHCPRKNVQVVTRFSSTPRKERKRIELESHPLRPTHATIAIAYDRMLGRDEFTIDGDGVYLVGQAKAKELASRRVPIDSPDHFVRPRVPTVIIREAHVVQAPETEQVVLSPKFTLVERRIPGHAFLSFDNQSERHERAKPKAFTLSTEHPDTYDVPGAAMAARETFKYPRRDRGTVDYKHMIGRVETATLQCHDQGDTNPTRDTRCVCLVDMDKASARC